MTSFVDTHCHLDAPEFGDEAPAVQARARRAGVRLGVIPAVGAFNFDTVRELAHRQGDVYALGIHPLFTPKAQQADLQTLARALRAQLDDMRLVAVGEIGLDYFVPELDGPTQEHFFRQQLVLARDLELPVLIHVRRSVDKVLRHLREVGRGRPWRGIAHAFNGSAQQAQACIAQGLKLGFGGAVTFERALQLRRLAAELPLQVLVLETDAPDIPPHWLYRTQAERDAGQPQGRNEPAELPRIAQVIADLRGMPLQALAEATTRNACEAMPRLAHWLDVVEAPCEPAQQGPARGQESRV
ncbi:TatD family hydrolase [Xenophilus arseniciresistens]|uniref:TatD family hydrolase n=1 Tax=Xenophilus arseniciresistens TaxID=1283306 RepID=A0AAE3N7R6_9BURK|nr:TatD family hydrolase [Xenophilus arseniciresistens]MDA7416433.1 TatD family hydrolase [Xenophilus arseniciresistens]